jgi:hypothetical protein
MEEFLGYCQQRLVARGVAITQMDDPGYLPIAGSDVGRPGRTPL